MISERASHATLYLNYKQMNGSNHLTPTLFIFEILHPHIKKYLMKMKEWVQNDKEKQRP